MQKKLKCVIYTLTLCIFFAPIGAAETSSTSGTIITVKGTYEQKNYSAKTKKTRVSSGHFVLSRERGITWYTEKPQASITVMTEQKIVQVFPNGTQKTLGDAGNPVFSSVAALTKALFTQDTAVIESSLRATQHEDGSWTYVPKDKTLASVIKKIALVHADTGYISSVALTYGNGDKTEYVLSVSSLNVPLTQDEKAYFEK